MCHYVGASGRLLLNHVDSSCHFSRDGYGDSVLFNHECVVATTLRRRSLSCESRREMAASAEENFIEQDAKPESDSEDTVENGVEMEFSEEPVSRHVAGRRIPLINLVFYIINIASDLLGILP